MPFQKITSSMTQYITFASLQHQVFSAAAISIQVLNRVTALVNARQVNTLIAPNRLRPCCFESALKILDKVQPTDHLKFSALHTGSPLQGIISVRQRVNTRVFNDTTVLNQCRFILWKSAPQELRHGNICTCALCVPVTDSLCMSACHMFHRKVLTALVCGQDRKQDVDQMLPRPLFLKINHFCILK